MSSQPVILFDGVCNFCNASINFVIRHDKAGRFRFAPLQSAIGNEMLRRFGLPTTDFDTFVLIEGEKVYTRSTAAIRVLEQLQWPYRWAAVFKIFPRFLRDPVYNIVAKNRYKWFGRREVCMLPTPEVSARFLN